jgi:hypothetical protein
MLTPQTFSPPLLRYRASWTKPGEIETYRIYAIGINDGASVPTYCDARDPDGRHCSFSEDFVCETKEQALREYYEDFMEGIAQNELELAVRREELAKLKVDAAKVMSALLREHDRTGYAPR